MLKSVSRLNELAVIHTGSSNDTNWNSALARRHVSSEGFYKLQSVVTCHHYGTSCLHRRNPSSSPINPLTPNDLKRRRAVSPLKIKIPGKNMREKPANTQIIHSVY
jgi:hypothetical protein